MATTSLRVVFITVSCLVLPLTCALTAESLNDIIFSGNYEFVDLTHPFHEKTVYWPGTQQFEYTKKTEKYVDGNNSWYAAYEFAAGEHGGTHIDAPFHFSMSGKRVGDISLDKLIVPLIIIDISSKVNGNPNFVLHKLDIDHLLNNNMGKPCVIIIKFGWSQYFNDRSKYLGLDEKTNTVNFPGLSAEVAEWIVTYKNIVGVGVDVASVDPGASADLSVHKIFSKTGLYNIENVNLEKPISDFKCTALVLPMKLAAGTGAPLRLAAICPKETPKYL